MRRVIITALASATVGLASPAFAGLTFTQYNGKDLTTAIHASPDDPSVAPTVGSIVYGNTNVHSGHDTSFQGFSYYDPGGTFGQTSTSISITEGSGFAQINDTDFDSKTPSTENLFAIIMDPPDFSDYEFSIQLAAQGTVNVFYMLTGSTMWISGWSGISQNANANTQYLLSSNPDVSIDKVLITSSAPIFELKQNSINLFGAAALPEPGTWGLMLLGFAGIGLALRRNRKTRPGLMRVA
jgi:hypothetical protein